MGSVFNGEGGALSALADGHVGHVVEGDGRSVHSYRHFFFISGGAGIIASAHGSRSHYGVSGGGVGGDLNTGTVAVGDGSAALAPGVSEDAGVGSIGNFKGSGTALADGHIGHVVQCHCRSVHIHGERLGVGGSTGYVVGVDGSRGHYGINGGVAGVDSDGSGVPSVLGAVVAPCVGNGACAGGGFNGERRSVSIGFSTDGGAGGLDVAEYHGRCVHVDGDCTAGSGTSSLTVGQYNSITASHFARDVVERKGTAGIIGGLIAFLPCVGVILCSGNAHIGAGAHGEGTGGLSFAGQNGQVGRRQCVHHDGLAVGADG